MTTEIEMPEPDICPFCDYLAGRRPYTVLVKDALVSVLVTREQRGICHVLVMPTCHRPTILDLTEEEGGSVMSRIIEVARAIREAAAPKGIAIWQNNGVPAHQTIPHAHFHVAGTLPDGGTEWGDVRESSLEETDQIATQLREVMSALA